MDTPLSKAKDLLDIWIVWEAAGLPRPASKDWGTCGVVSSPFRDDKNPSFSVKRDGKVYFDHAEDEGGDVIEFIKRAYNLDFIGGRSKALELARVEDDLKSHREVTRAERQRMAIESRNQKAMAHSERVKRAFAEPVVDLDFRVWPGEVEARWVEGRSYLMGHEPKLRYLAGMRGWPVEWALGLAEMGLVSLPVKAGYEIGSGAPRAWAFLVEMPRDGDLEPLGYHQYTPFFDKKTEKNKKVWQYFPNDKVKDRPSSYQRALAELGRVVPGLPFAIGNFTDPEAVFILEGQWDAITYFGHVGGFGSCGSDILVLGCRGVSSQDYVLSAWRHLVLGAEVALIPQNDFRGLAWVRRDREGLGPESPCFADRLRALAGKLTVKEVPGDGMDFNDYYQAMVEAGKVGV